MDAEFALGLVDFNIMVLLLFLTWIVGSLCSQLLILQCLLLPPETAIALAALSSVDHVGALVRCRHVRVDTALEILYEGVEVGSFVG